MGIPLAALAVQPPPNPIDSAAKAVALKGLLQNQQYQAQAQPIELQQRQQALEQQQQENQQRALAIKDDQTMRDLSTKYVQKDADGKMNGYDFNGFLNDARSQGVSPAKLNQMGAQQAQYAESLVHLSDQQKTNEQNKNKALYETVEGIRKLPEAQRGAALAASLPSLQKQGVDVAPLTQASKFDDASLDQFEATLGMHRQMLDDDEKRAKIEKDAAEAAKEKMEVEQGGTTEQRELNDFLKKNPNKTASDYVVWKAQHSPTVLLQGTGGGAGDPMVDMVGLGRIDLPTVLQRMQPAAKSGFISQLAAKYPQFSQAQYGVEKKVQEEFTSGDAAKNLTAFNTAISHAQQAQEAATALQNGDIKVLNRVGNALGVELGSDKVTNFNTIKSALTGEISKVFKGGQATDAEIKEVQGPFDAANSPAQLKNALNTAIHLMNSKRDALKQQYETGIQGKPNFGQAASPKQPAGATHTGIGSVDKKKHWLDASGKDLGPAE
jgi:hypothetical protein